MWIGAGEKYAGFTWRDASIYQIFIDRFLDADPSNNINNAAGDLARVTDWRSEWQGGDFKGITQKLRDGYFEQMGINTLWISSPIIELAQLAAGGVALPTRRATRATTRITRSRPATPPPITSATPRRSSPRSAPRTSCTSWSARRTRAACA